MEAYLQGRWHDARKRIERILTLDETDADALMHLGTLHLRLEQPALARQAFRQCLELEGGSEMAVGDPAGHEAAGRGLIRRCVQATCDRRWRGGRMLNSRDGDEPRLVSRSQDPAKSHESLPGPRW